MMWLLGTVVCIVALALSSIVGAPLTAAVLRLASHSTDAGAPDELAPPSATTEGTATQQPGQNPDRPAPASPQPALRGGTWIGILERLAITGAIMLGYPSAVAIVVAIKGLGRYPELREHPGSSERFVIGTLSSFLWASVIGVLVRALLGWDAVSSITLG